MNLYVLILIAAFTGGSTPVFGKLALNHFSPFTVVFLRFLFASLVLLPLVKKHDLTFGEFRKNGKTALVGAINPILFFIGLPYIQASATPLIYAAVPVMAALYTRFVLKQHITKRQTLGLSIGFFGVAFIVLLPLFGQGVPLSSLTGNLLILVAAMFFTAYGFMSKGTQSNHGTSPIAITLYFSLVSMALVTPLMIYELMSHPLSQLSLGWSPLFSVMYLGIVGTGLSYVSYQHALKISSVVTASVFTFLQPIASIGLAMLILGEKPTYAFFVGGLCAVVGAHFARSRTA